MLVCSLSNIFWQAREGSSIVVLKLDEELRTRAVEPFAAVLAKLETSLITVPMDNQELAVVVSTDVLRLWC